MSLPGLSDDGRWHLPKRLNMAAQCLEHPKDKIAIVEINRRDRHEVTYGELGAMVDDVARALITSIRAGDRVGVLLSQSAWCAAAHLAIWKIGAISVPLFKLFRSEALRSRIDNAGCQIVLTDSEGELLLKGLAQSWLINQVGQSGEPIAYAETSPDSPAILIYTSGTTGQAKGALHGHRVLTGHIPGVYLSHNHLGIADDMLWTPADWAWIGGLFDVLMVGLALGVPVIAARFDKFTPELCVELIGSAGIRNIFFPPTALKILKAANQKISGLRSVAAGGEPLGKEMLQWGQEAFGLNINEFYGQTECNMFVSSCAEEFSPKAGCIGKVVPGFTVDVIDANGNPTTAEGDIAVRKGAAAMMLSYWGRPKETEAKYRNEWLVTGDRGIWDGEFLRFLGREDDVITSGGYRIGPAEIEDCLLTHPDVENVGVVGKPDPTRTEIVKAYVVCKAGRQPLADELQDWVKQRLASYSYPREIAFINELPMTVTGKVVRKVLKDQAISEAECGE